VYVMAKGAGWNSYPLSHYENKEGMGMRHPKEYPWNNPLNFTRDQLMPLVAGLDQQNNRKPIKRMFYKHAKRLFFCQNIERDCPGTRKRPYPHIVSTCKGSDNGRRSWGDYADPLAPHHIGAFIIAARAWAFYPFLPVAYVFAMIAILLRPMSDDNDQGALVATLKIMGLLWLLKLVDKKYMSRWENYFCGWRSKQELYEVVRRGL
ncbi:MAG: hypothetical protein ACK53L_33555, partial [Pirellulaceae bacterium]